MDANLFARPPRLSLFAQLQAFRGWPEERRDAALVGAVVFGQIHAKSATEFVMMLLARL